MTEARRKLKEKPIYIIAVCVCVCELPPSDIRRELGVEPLLLRVERSPLRWFGHLIRMPPGRLPLEAFQAHPTGRRLRGRPRTRWRDYFSQLACRERLGIPQNELGNVSLLGPLPPRPDLG